MLIHALQVNFINITNRPPPQTSFQRLEKNYEEIELKTIKFMWGTSFPVEAVYDEVQKCAVFIYPTSENQKLLNDKQVVEDK